jgi:hypothetical protein
MNRLSSRTFLFACDTDLNWCEIAIRDRPLAIERLSS